jgi:TRAP-type C4-dicarboxylate transport system permease small subunit
VPRSKLRLLLAVLDRALSKVVSLSALLGLLAGWGYLGTAVLITSDIVTRRFLGFNTQATTELSGYMLAIGISFSLAHTLASKGHIRVDAALMRFPLRIRAYLHVVAVGVLASLATLMALRAWDVAVESWELGSIDRTPLAIPLVVPQAIWTFGFVVFAVLGVFLFVWALINLMLGRYPVVEDRLLSGSDIGEMQDLAVQPHRGPGGDRDGRDGQA